jgi:hypothetical protein
MIDPITLACMRLTLPWDPLQLRRGDVYEYAGVVGRPGSPGRRVVFVHGPSGDRIERNPEELVRSPSAKSTQKEVY